MRHEAVGHRLRHPRGRASPVPGQQQLADRPQVGAEAVLAEQRGHRGMQYITGHDVAGGGCGAGRVTGQAAVHHADDLDGGRIAPGSGSGGAHQPCRLPGLGR